LASGAGGAAGAIAWGGAPQLGAQPQGYETHDMISPGGASDFKKWWLKRNQREHHRKKTFEEYIELLNENRIEFIEIYLW
jgi:hypothetical protein